MNDIPTATDPDIERIARRLFDYITKENLSQHTLKLSLCEALYEMQALARGERPNPVISVLP